VPSNESLFWYKYTEEPHVTRATRWSSRMTTADVDKQ